MAKLKKEASLYDANGRWIEERGRIKGAIRRTFRLFPQLKEAKQRARVELPPKILKDGSTGKKNQVRYRCAICQDLFPDKYTQVDHISPVVPLYMKEGDMSYDLMVKNICCGLENLQVICSTPKKIAKDGKPSCHNTKTNEENFIRDILSEECRSGKVDMGAIPFRIIELKEQYKSYLAEKEKLRLEKLKRKADKEAKKKKAKEKNEPVK